MFRAIEQNTLRLLQKFTIHIAIKKKLETLKMLHRLKTIKTQTTKKLAAKDRSHKKL